jgi:hypothetical protein
MLSLCAAIVAGHAAWSEEPAAKGEPRVYTIECKYVETGKDGTEKAVPIPTIVAEEGTSAVFRTEGRVSLPGVDGTRHTVPFGYLLEVRLTGLKDDRVRLGTRWCRCEPINVTNADPQVPHLKTEAFNGQCEGELGKVVEPCRIDRPDGSQWRLEIKVDEFREREEVKREGIGHTFAF